jgi:hypothetical protein
MSDIERQIGDAAEYVAGKIDRVVDGAADMLTGQSGKKIVGGAAVGALAAVVLPVSLVGGVALGAGYAVLRQFGRDHQPHHPHGADHAHGGPVVDRAE